MRAPPSPGAGCLPHPAVKQQMSGWKAQPGTSTAASTPFRKRTFRPTWLNVTPETLSTVLWGHCPVQPHLAVSTSRLASISSGHVHHTSASSSSASPRASKSSSSLNISKPVGHLYFCGKATGVYHTLPCQSDLRCFRSHHSKVSSKAF